MNRQESKYQYTASLMDEALLLLLEQKDYTAITVKEVCQKAGVNRSTFYLHYESMNDLLDETVDMINGRFKASLSSVPADDPSKVVLTSEKYLRPYLNFIMENRRAYKVIHQKDHLFNSQKTFESFYRSIFSPALTYFCQLPVCRAQSMHHFGALIHQKALLQQCFFKSCNQSAGTRMKSTLSSCFICSSFSAGLPFCAMLNARYVHLPHQD